MTTHRRIHGRESAVARAGLVAAVCLVLTPILWAEDAALVPEPMRDTGITEKLGDYVPLGLTFTDEHGQERKLREYYTGDRPVLLNLVYFTCANICNPMLRGMVTAVKEVDFTVGEDYDIITVSIQPEETPELAGAMKRGYLEIYDREGATDGWHVHVGTEANIRTLAEAVGFGYRWDEATQQFAHGAAIIFTAPDGKIVRYLGGVAFEPKDVRMALLEAAQGKIGSPFDQVFFYCFNYDPKSGTYTPAVLNILRVLGAITVILLGGIILRMLMVETRARPDESGPGQQTQPTDAEPTDSRAEGDKSHKGALAGTGQKS